MASDFNPGSSHLSSMPFVLQLGVFTLGLTVEEAIMACTGNAAYAIGRHGSVGSLEAGKKMDLDPLRRPGPRVAGLRRRAEPGPDRDQEREGRRRGRPKDRPALMSPRLSPRLYVLRLAWLGRRAGLLDPGPQSPSGSRASFQRPGRPVLLPADIVPEPGQGDLAGHRDHRFLQMPAPHREGVVPQGDVGVDEGLARRRS
ncbi:MAG: hypothetical protein MZV70_38000 [Desulfobacterales bacterium]|nr:hypothetical protein [Desulfobacterales bacterium]